MSIIVILFFVIRKNHLIFFVEIDEEVAVSGILTDDNITDPVHGSADIDDVDEESSELIPHILMEQAKFLLILLRTFIEQSSNVDDKL